MRLGEKGTCFPILFSRGAACCMGDTCSILDSLVLCTVGVVHPVLQVQCTAGSADRTQDASSLYWILETFGYCYQKQKIIEILSIIILKIIITMNIHYTVIVGYIIYNEDEFRFKFLFSTCKLSFSVNTHTMETKITCKLTASLCLHVNLQFEKT